MDFKETADRYPRRVAAGFTVFSWGFSAWYANSVLEKARVEHPDAIAIPHAFAAMVAIGTLFAVLIFATPTFRSDLKSWKTRRRTMRDYMLIGAIAASGIAADLWISHELSKLGYPAW